MIKSQLNKELEKEDSRQKEQQIQYPNRRQGVRRANKKNEDQ